MSKKCFCVPLGVCCLKCPKRVGKMFLCIPTFCWHFAKMILETLLAMESCMMHKMWGWNHQKTDARVPWCSVIYTIIEEIPQRFGIGTSARTSAGNYWFRLFWYVLCIIFQICNWENVGASIEIEQAHERCCFVRWERGFGIKKSRANRFNNPENHAIWSYRLLQDQHVNLIAKTNKTRCVELALGKSAGPSLKGQQSCGDVLQCLFIN